MKKVLETPSAAAAVGPYNHAVETTNLIFFSGQVPLVPATGELAGPTIEAQVKQSLDNVEALLRDAGLTTDNVVKATIFLTDMGDFSVVNEAYAERFRKPYPARSTVAVAALPKGALVEIEVIAARS